MRALVYSGTETPVALAKLLKVMEYECHWEADISHLSQHISRYSPTLVLSNTMDEMTPPSRLPEGCAFYSCLRVVE